jgi:hypothetical protein
MEPAVSMTAYAAVNTIALVLLVISGYPETASVLAVVLAVWALALELTYRLRRKSDHVPEHRAKLDKLVRRQWALCLGCVAIAVVSGLNLGLTRTTRTDVEFLDGAVLVAFLSVWLSSLIDWYWVLPRLAGIGGPPPCQDTHSDTWNSVTKVWLYHRAIATLLFIGGVAAIPGYLSLASSNHALAVVLGVVTFGVPAVMSEQAAAAVKALMNGLNPSAPVGSIVRVRMLDVLTVYLVDVSLQGSKYKRLDWTSVWDEKSDGPQIRNDVLASSNMSEVVREAPSPCSPESCNRRNWYCRHNEKAYTRRG